MFMLYLEASPDVEEFAIGHQVIWEDAKRY